MSDEEKQGRNDKPEEQYDFEAEQAQQREQLEAPDRHPVETDRSSDDSSGNPRSWQETTHGGQRQHPPQSEDKDSDLEVHEDHRRVVLHRVHGAVLGSQPLQRSYLVEVLHNRHAL